MKFRHSLFVFTLILTMSACNLPSNTPGTETPTLAAMSPTATLALATSTPTQISVASNTSPPPITSTPTVPVAFPNEIAVNCRLGPNTAWIVLSGLSVGTSSQIVGKTADNGWWYIVDPFNSSRNCWVAASVTNTAGNLAGVPVVAAPQAMVTNATANVSPNTINPVVCPATASPIELSGSIEVNGPTTVTWHFETQQGGVLPNQTINFDAFGSEEVSTSYTPVLETGNFWVRLIVTSPNNMQAETKYTITCP